MADSMLIDGLIKFCDEKSKNIKLKAEPQVFVEIKQALEELKEYKLKEFQCHLAQQEGITIGYNKAIDEFREIFERAKILAKAYVDMFNSDDNYAEILSQCTTFYDDCKCDSGCLKNDMEILLDDIECWEEKTEQMKAGGIDG